VSPIAVVETMKSSDDHIADREPGPSLPVFMPDGVIGDLETGQPLAPAIDVIEHSLIAFFRPAYNEQLLNWNPERPTAAMKLVRSLGFRLILVQLSAWQGLARFYSQARPKPQRGHVAIHELVTSGALRDGQVIPSNNPTSFNSYQQWTLPRLEDSVNHLVERSGVG
jgi:hypothetical protein